MGKAKVGMKVSVSFIVAIFVWMVIICIEPQTELNTKHHHTVFDVTSYLLHIIPFLYLNQTYKRSHVLNLLTMGLLSVVLSYSEMHGNIWKTMSI